jgi:hypothetical protein
MTGFGPLRAEWSSPDKVHIQGSSKIWLLGTGTGSFLGTGTGSFLGPAQAIHGQNQRGLEVRRSGPMENRQVT